ncbi:hypothetical protein [Prevotella fusca]|uniref:hypothetical protein n=1 Tax=Prevotella fusca TaxID=589436 RepID=UPI003FA0E7B2
MERIRIKMFLSLLLLCLSVSAQTEYSGVAGASPGLVKANKQAAAKESNHTAKAGTSSAASKSQTAHGNSVKTSKDANPQQTADNDSAEVEVKQGFKTFSRGMGKVFKREVKSMGEVTRKIGDDGKKFFKKLGKGISDSFKSDSTATK